MIFFGITEQRRAQLSLYIIFSILALIFALFAFRGLFAADTGTDAGSDAAPELALAAKSVRIAVTQCLEQELQNAALFVAERGGYFAPPKHFLDFAADGSPLVSMVPYYALYTSPINEPADSTRRSSSVLVPSGEKLENSIADYLRIMAPNCTRVFFVGAGDSVDDNAGDSVDDNAGDNAGVFAGVHAGGYDITFGEPDISVTLTPGFGTAGASSAVDAADAAPHTRDILAAAVSLPTTVRLLDEGSEITFSDYAVSAETRIGEALRAAEKIIFAGETQDEMHDGEPALCLSCLPENTPRGMALSFFETASAVPSGSAVSESSGVSESLFQNSGSSGASEFPEPVQVIIFQLHYNESFGGSFGSGGSAAHGVPAVFQFAAQYSAYPAFPEETGEDIRSVRMRSVGMSMVRIANAEALVLQKVKVGVPFSFRVVAVGNTPDTGIRAARRGVGGIRFSDDTSLFDIAAEGDDAGRISFTPLSDDVGAHLIEIRAESRNGAWDSAIMQLEVAP